jgi:protein-arginine kinase activator protein McsA
MEIDDLSDLGEEMEEEDEEPWAVTNVLHQKKDMCHEKSGRSLSPQFSVCESWKMGFKEVKKRTWRCDRHGDIPEFA